MATTVDIGLPEADFATLVGRGVDVQALGFQAVVVREIGNGDLVQWYDLVIREQHVDHTVLIDAVIPADTE